VVYNTEEHSQCHRYFNGLFNSNMYSSLKGMLQSFKNILFEWESARGSWAEIKQLMKMPEMITFLSAFNFIMTTTYYAITVGLTNTIVFELDNNLAFVDLYSGVLEIVLFLIFVLMLVILIGPIQRIFEKFYALFYIIPFEILEANMTMRHKLKRIGEVDKFFKL